VHALGADTAIRRFHAFRKPQKGVIDAPKLLTATPATPPPRLLAADSQTQRNRPRSRLAPIACAVGARGRSSRSSTPRRARMFCGLRWDIVASRDREMGGWMEWDGGRWCARESWRGSCWGGGRLGGGG